MGDDLGCRSQGSFHRYGYDAYLDDVKIVAGDLTGPRVVGHVPTDVVSSGGPLTTVTVTFDEAIDTGTFSGNDVVLKDPQGVEVTPVNVAAVGGSGDTEFELTFASQDVRGTYRLTVGPDILDVAGNAMNQDGDSTGGEAEQDDYNGTVDFEETARSDVGAEPDLYIEGFEGWTPVPTYWGFNSNWSGTTKVVSTDEPHSGSGHLEFYPGATYVGRSATLCVDLSSMAGRTDVSLEYWAKRTYVYGDFTVAVSGDGQSWHTVWSGDPPTYYQQYGLDLDAAASANDIALDGDVYVRFRDYNLQSNGQKAYLDDVRIMTGEREGPRVTGIVPTEVSSSGGPLTTVTVTFDEAIDTGTFTEDDVDFPGKSGQVTMQGQIVHDHEAPCIGWG